jgi:hypothetical protein
MKQKIYNLHNIEVYKNLNDNSFNFTFFIKDALNPTQLSNPNSPFKVSCDYEERNLKQLNNFLDYLKTAQPLWDQTFDCKLKETLDYIEIIAVFNKKTCNITIYSLINWYSEQNANISVKQINAGQKLTETISLEEFSEIVIELNKYYKKPLKPSNPFIQFFKNILNKN